MTHIARVCILVVKQAARGDRKQEDNKERITDCFSHIQITINRSKYTQKFKLSVSAHFFPGDVELKRLLLQEDPGQVAEGTNGCLVMRAFALPMIPDRWNGLLYLVVQQVRAYHWYYIVVLRVSYHYLN